MKICPSLIFFFFLTLQDGNAGLLSAEPRVFERTEGETVTVECTLYWSLLDRPKKMFCRNDCDDGDVLVETPNKSIQKGRYSIREGSSYKVFSVTITDLKESDSGRYQCVLEGLLKDGKHKFEIKVTKAKVDDKKTPKPSPTPRPSVSERAPTSASTTTTTTSTNSTSGSASAFTELSFSSSSTSESKTQPTGTTKKGLGIPLYVGLFLVVIVILFTAALVVLRRNKLSKPKEPQMDMEFTSVAEANIVYEDLKENKQNQSNPMQISAAHASSKFTTQTPAPTSDVYSLATAAGSQDQTADASETLIYTQVDFSKRTSSLFSSAPQSQTPEVVYSALSPPLYSTVNQPQ